MQNDKILAEQFAPPPSFECIAISAKTGLGIPQLCDTIGRRLAAAAGIIETAPAGIGSERQKNLVEAACAALAEAQTMAHDNLPLDLISPCIREAVNALGEITGEVSTADILEAMFSRFCVGK
jgi:tRNA modification GTPase